MEGKHLLYVAEFISFEINTNIMQHDDVISNGANKQQSTTLIVLVTALILWCSQIFVSEAGER